MKIVHGQQLIPPRGLHQLIVTILAKGRKIWINVKAIGMLNMNAKEMPDNEQHEDNHKR